jgi:O-antigen/teichoic acid export membrane protein
MPIHHRPRFGRGPSPGSDDPSQVAASEVRASASTSPHSGTGNEASQQTRMLASMGVLLASRGAILVLQFLVIAILGRRLGPSTFGMLQMGLAVFAYAGFASDLGLTTVGTREAARAGVVASGAALVGARLILTAVVVSAVGICTLALPLDPLARWLSAVLTVGTMASAINLRWLAQGRERFRLLAVADIAGAVVQLAGSIVIVVGPADLVPAGIVMVSAPIISTLILLRQPQATAVLQPRFSSKTIALIRVALPLGASAIAIQLYNNADSILLGLFRGAESVGWYGAAYRIVYAVLAVPFAAHAVVLPMVARLASTDEAQIRPLLLAASRGLLLFAIPAATGLTLTAPLVVALAFGPAYAASALPLSLLAWVCVTVSANAPFGALMLARGQDRAYLLATGLGSLLNVGVNLLVIPLWGMTGAAVTTLAEETLVLVALAWFTRDYARSILPTATIRTSVAAAIMAAAIWPLRTSIASVPLGVIVFVVAGTITGAIPARASISVLRKVMRRRPNRPGR